MKKILLSLAAVLAVGQTGFAAPAGSGMLLHRPEGGLYLETDREHDEQSPDSMRMVQLQSIQVVTNRAGEKTPMAYTDVNRAVLEKINTGVDLPFLLLQTPSVIATSEAGAGIGYTSIRIRGTDATRINVTANGIPMNDAESHGLFWVNMPDITASVEDIQVQRGVGTSTNGAGAFGGSINLRTQNISPAPYAELSGSYGSFNTHRESVNVGTGLVGGRWAFNARLSQISSDGYRDRASTDLKSYFVQGGYYGRNTVVKLITFAGKEKTYHAWDAISKSKLASDRRYNPCGEITGFVYNADGTLLREYNAEYDTYDPVSKKNGVLQRPDRQLQPEKLPVAVHPTPYGPSGSQSEPPLHRWAGLLRTIQERRQIKGVRLAAVRSGRSGKFPLLRFGIGYGYQIQPGKAQMDGQRIRRRNVRTGLQWAEGTGYLRRSGEQIQRGPLRADSVAAGLPFRSELHYRP